MNWKEFYDYIQECYHIEDEQSVKKIDFNHIIEVNSKELTYENSDGKIDSINLSDCVNNFDSINGQLKNSEGRKLNCVGGRYYTNRYAFYEFFTSPHIRFCLNYKRSKFKEFIMMKIGFDFYGDQFSNFYSLQKKLSALGYTAIDLT